MYLSITNVGHKKTKYFIVDQSEELNLPDLPSGYTIAFQELYTNNFKVLNDEELKKVFSNNTLLYEILGFNSSFKLSIEDVKKDVDEVTNIFLKDLRLAYEDGKFRVAGRDNEEYVE